MAILRSCAEIEGSEEKNEKRVQAQPLIPGLPDEVAELCLLHLPYPYQALVRSVCSSWNKAIRDPGFLLCRRSLSLAQPHLFVFAYHKSTARIQWQALDPRSGRWFLLPPMPCPRAVCPPGFACASIPRQGKLFVLGGMRSDTETPLRSTIVYHANTNQWSLASPMPTPRSFFAAGAIDDKILAVGGSGNAMSDAITAVECYDPKNDTWAAVAKIRWGLARYDSAVVGNRMYVTEGWTWPFMFSPRGSVYDPDRDAWAEMEAGMREGWTGISIVLGNRLFVISEHGDCPMKVYVPGGDTWRYVGGQKFPCDSLKRPFVASGLDGKIFVVARSLNVAIGRVIEVEKEEWRAEWQVLAAPEAFRDFSPSNCQLLYA